MTTNGRPPPRVRPRNRGDLRGCARVLTAVHEHDGYPVNLPPCPEEWLDPPGLLAAWVVETGGGPAGHAALLRPSPDDAAPAARRSRAPGGDAQPGVVGRLFTAPWVRGRGAGALLLRQAEEGARERGLHPVLDVVATDTAALALYERLGWQRLATAERRWGARTVLLHSYAAPDAPAR